MTEFPKEARFDLCANRGKVYVVDDYGHGKRYTGPWPVPILIEAIDFQDGDGWDREDIASHGTILGSYRVPGGITQIPYAVLVDVASPKDFAALDRVYTIYDDYPDEEDIC